MGKYGEKVQCPECGKSQSYINKTCCRCGCNFEEWREKRVHEEAKRMVDEYMNSINEKLTWRNINFPLGFYK